jgi:hypothetical protein
VVATTTIAETTEEIAIVIAMAIIAVDTCFAGVSD